MTEAQLQQLILDSYTAELARLTDWYLAINNAGSTAQQIADAKAAWLKVLSLRDVAEKGLTSVRDRRSRALEYGLP